MKTNVFLADLRHTYVGVLSTDSMPLNVGFMKAVMDRDLPVVDSRLFVYPEKLLDALEARPPEVLMLSNYCWNEKLSLCFARQAKKLRPGTLVVFGGPNIHDEPERQVSWVESHPEIDLYVLGEGDFLATEIVSRFLAAGGSIPAFREMDLPSSIYRRPDGTMVRTEIRPRKGDLTEIPSP